MITLDILILFIIHHSSGGYRVIYVKPTKRSRGCGQKEGADDHLHILRTQTNNDQLVRSRSKLQSSCSRS